MPIRSGTGGVSVRAPARSLSATGAHPLTSVQYTATRRTPGDTWSGGRTPKWVQAILDEHAVDLGAFASVPMYGIQAPG